MRRFSLILLQLAISIATIGQSCLPEGIIFSAQSQIDSFAINYPGCTCIEGDVQILGPDIADLEGLGVLDSIKGNFTIGHYWNASNPELENLDGLENLSYIGGDLIIQHNASLINIEGLSGLDHIIKTIKIEGNPITDLAGLEGIDTIHSDLYIWGNDELSDLTGFNNVRCIEGDLNLWSNENLHYLTGLENLDRVIESIIIEGSDGLFNFTGLNNLHSAGFLLISSSSVSSLSGLENLDTLHHGLSMEYNYELTSLDGLSGLTYNGGGINLEMNQYLARLDGLSALTHLGGELRLVWNTALTSLSGLENIDPGSIGNITICLNHNLSECDITSLCNYLSSPNGRVTIFNNDNGCNNPHEIADQCGIDLQCLPYGNYYFTCQADVDSFPSYFPDCNNLQGTMWIEGEDITDLDSLNGIDTISGWLYICGNPNLSSLEGLQNIKTVTEDLSLGLWEHGGNSGLTDLTGLNGLSSVGKYMLILGNNTLTSLTGLDSLETIGERLEIIENRSLISLVGMEHLHSLISITISGNDSLFTLDGIQNLVNVEQSVELTYNPMLFNIEGIRNVLADSLYLLMIRNNPSLSECNVQSVCDFLGIPGSYAFISDNDTSCNSPEEVLATCEVGIENVPATAKLFRLYPNPASDILIVEINGNPVDHEITILDLSGREVLNKRLADNPIGINVSNFPGGIYFVRLKSDLGISVQKFVKTGF